MSPNSKLTEEDSEVIGGDRHNTSTTISMGGEDSLGSATTDGAAGAANSPDEPIANEEKKPEAEEHQAEDGTSEDNGFDEFLSIITSADALAAKDDSSSVPPAPAEAAVKSPANNSEASADEYIGLVDSSDPAEGGPPLLAAPSSEDKGAPLADDDAPISPNHRKDDDNNNNDQNPVEESENSSTASNNAEGDEIEGVTESEKNTESLEGDDKEELLVDDPPIQRRRSSEFKSELQKNSLLNSINTVDSWDGKEGSLPPLERPHPHQMAMPEILTTSGDLLPDLDNDIKLDSAPQDKNNEDQSEGSKSSTERPTRRATGGSDCSDDVADYVNINKLLTPSSSQYYYSQANRSNRQILEKVKSKKVIKQNSLDESSHSKASIISVRTHQSAYRGPVPLKRDGTMPRGAIKMASRDSVGMMSMDSLLTQEEERNMSDGRISSGSPKLGPMKRCSFSSVDIREHERIAGDNPCVTSGVPLSIGWGYHQHQPISLDDYETHKGPSRDKIEMMVPAGIRRQMLRDEFGVSISEMNAAMREVNVTKRHRRHTCATENMEGWTEVLQSAKRKVKRFVKGTSNEKEEEKLWSYAHKSAMSKDGSLGNDPQGAGVGSINKGPKIAPQENGREGVDAPHSK